MVTSYDHQLLGKQILLQEFGVPKTAPSVTYGTNGFFLKFENASNMDVDSSGNNLTFLHQEH